MPTNTKKILGTMMPLGGGDPIPLTKEEVLIGRRPTSDIRLDFDSVSGKHCVLRLIHGVWHIRDLASTNGTTVNGQKIAHEVSLLPDDEFGIASHYYRLDYEPTGPATILQQSQMLDEDLVESRKQHSLLELAGLSSDFDRRETARAPRPPSRPIPISSIEDADFEDVLPEDVRKAPKPKVETDDDFFKMIEDDLKDPKNPRG